MRLQPLAPLRLQPLLLLHSPEQTFPSPHSAKQYPPPSPLTLHVNCGVMVSWMRATPRVMGCSEASSDT